MTTDGTLRGALIGCGNVARYHLTAWSRVEGVELAALCESDPARLAAAAGRVPGARTYPSADALFAAERLDFVEICTGPAAHLALTETAARHGAHVLCQKPAAADRGGLVAMIAACEAAGVRLMVHENWRFRPWYRALHAEVDAGTVGRPVRVRIAHADTRALRPGGFDEQPFLADRPRLILLEMGSHLVDAARYLLGEVRSVYAVTARFGEGHPGEDVATLLLGFESRALGLLDMTWCAAPDLARPAWALNETVVEGTAGTLRVEPDGSLRLVDLRGRAERREVALPPEDEVYLQGYLATQSHFIDGLRTGAPHETDGPDTLRTMDVVWAAYRSADEGRTVLLP